MKLEYPEFQPARYGVVLDNFRNRPFLCPGSFFLGDVLVTPASQLEQEIENWLDFKRAEHDFEPLFDFNRDFMVQVEEKTKRRKIVRTRKRKLINLTAEQLVFALLRKIKLHDKTLSIWNYHEDNAVYGANSGTQVLTGKVKSIGDARESQRTKYHLVSIDDPFDHNSTHFNNVTCTCEDSFWMGAKQGNKNAQIICVHAAAIIDFISKHPTKIENYAFVLEAIKRRIPSVDSLELVVPFHTDSIDAEVLKWLKEEDHSYISKGEQPSLSNLKIDVLLARYFGGMSYFDLAKLLLRLPVYDERVINWIIDNKAGFEVLPQKQLFGTEEIATPVQKLYEALNSYLYRERFHLKGYVLEKKGSPHEVIAINYVHRNGNEIRVVFSKNYPPVIVRRTPIKGARFYPFKESETRGHIFYHLYHNERTGRALRGLDDRTRRPTNINVELPPCFIPNELLADYKEVIERETPGGCKALVKAAEQGKIDRRSLIYKIQKAL